VASLSACAQHQAQGLLNEDLQRGAFLLRQALAAPQQIARHFDGGLFDKEVAEGEETACALPAPLTTSAVPVCNASSLARTAARCSAAADIRRSGLRASSRGRGFMSFPVGSACAAAGNGTCSARGLA
jgi:hypothetical protein